MFFVTLIFLSSCTNEYDERVDLKSKFPDYDIYQITDDIGGYMVYYLSKDNDQFLVRKYDGDWVTHKLLKVKYTSSQVDYSVENGSTLKVVENKDTTLKADVDSFDVSF